MSPELAILGGIPVRTKPWPKWPVHDQSDAEALLGVLQSGVWGIGGKKVSELEAAFAALHNARFGVACCNGTIGLQIALVAAGVQPGDEVITTPYTFMATALAAVEVGAVPVFVDVEPGTHNLDPALIEAAITPRTRALIPVHIGGRPCDMDRIMEIARRRGLAVVEDACQAWTAAWRGTPVGAIGDLGMFSFQSSKNLSAGEGGLVLTNDEKLYQRAWSYHNCGRSLGGEWYVHDFPGMNFRLTEFQAALLLSLLKRFPAQQETRRRSMAVLQRELAPIPGLLVPDIDPRITAHACHMFMVRLDRRLIQSEKMAVIKALNAEGIPANPGYTTALYRQNFWNWFGARPVAAGGPAWKETWPRPYSSYNLPVCEEHCAGTIWIKQDVLLAGPEEMGDVVEAFARVAAAAAQGRL